MNTDLLSVNLLATAIGHEDESTRDESASLFLQYSYLSRTLLRDFEISIFKYWNVPHPDISPWLLSPALSGLVHRFTSTVDSALSLGDPDPEPNKAFTKAAHLQAIKVLSTKLQGTLAQLEKTAARLRQ